LRAWGQAACAGTELRGGASRRLRRPGAPPRPQEVDWTRPTAFVLGNEKDGVSQTAVDMADALAVVPMAGEALGSPAAALMCEPAPASQLLHPCWAECGALFSHILLRAAGFVESFNVSVAAAIIMVRRGGGKGRRAAHGSGAAAPPSAPAIPGAAAHGAFPLSPAPQWEAQQQRLRRTGVHGDLSDRERDVLLAEFLIRGVVGGCLGGGARAAGRLASMA
jgi:hypothetical protein